MQKLTDLINTPLQRGGLRQQKDLVNRFNGFHTSSKTVETVGGLAAFCPTPLKRGVNENQPPETFVHQALSRYAPVLVAAICLCPLLAPAVILQEVCAFGGDQRDEVVQGLDGHFYGTTQRGGCADKGTIYRVTTNGVLTTLVSFIGTNGALPLGELMRASDGYFYGTTAYGGTNDQGTIYRVTTNGALTTLVSFAGANGAIPMATLLEGHDGHFYGTTIFGGVDNYGTVFRLSAEGVLETLASLPAPLWPTKRFVSSVIQATDGNLYGVTANDIEYENGMIFSVTTNGLLTRLLAFPGVVRNAHVCPGVVQGPDGNLYGATRFEGSFGKGSLFKATLSGTLTTIVSFNGANGSFPYTRLVQTAEGDFYGTTTSGGAHNFGTVFKFTPNVGLTTVVSFDGANGGTPCAGLVHALDGHFYGVTSKGGLGGGGTFFRLTRPGVLTSLADFLPLGVSARQPHGGLVQTGDGNFYGVTRFGGTHDMGTAFKLTPEGILTTLVSFTGNNGALPFRVRLEQASDGAFYGTTIRGGASDKGTVFKLTPDGVLTTLVSFTGGNGSQPGCGLTRGSDENFYGVTWSGGTYDQGTAFRMTTNGLLTPLAHFSGANGATPVEPLSQASDGNLYGTTMNGGSSGYGTVFKISTSNGLINTLISFSKDNGARPECSLLEASDGYLYGNTYHGGDYDKGTLFRLTKNGLLTVLFSFDGPKGAYPRGRLLQAADGSLYGTTIHGGASDVGTIFRLKLDGAFTKLMDFTYANSSEPGGELIQAGDGSIYGKASGGGSRNGGNVFRLALHSVTGLQMVQRSAILNCSGVPYQSYDIQATSDLRAAVWETLGPPMIADENGLGQFVDTSAKNFPARYYRLAPQ